MAKIVFDEKELEDFLCKDGNLKKHLGLRLLARQYRTPFGVIDLLAYHALSKSFVIIELKKDTLGADAFFQIEGYFQALNSKRKFYLDRRDYRRCDFLLPKRLRNTNLIKLLVGSSLSEKLYPCVELWERDQWTNNADTYYALFGTDLETGIAFNYYNIGQRQYAEQISDYGDLYE